MDPILDHGSETSGPSFRRTALTRVVLADLDTPLSTYLKLADGPYSYLLESVEGGEKWGRYSIIGLPARTVLKVCGHRVAVYKDGTEIEASEVVDPLDFIRAYLGRFEIPEDDRLQRFAGGFVGYFGYDVARYGEKKLVEPPTDDPLGSPDIVLMLSDEFIVFDNLRGEIQLVCYIDPEDDVAKLDANRRLDELTAKLESPTTSARYPASGPTASTPKFESEFGEQAFLDSIERIKEYIYEGDVMQVVLAQRMSAALTAPPIDVYRALRRLNPSPYMYFMDLGDFHVVGSSPEILVRLDGRTVTTRPLAGTRPRGATEEQDLALERELLDDPKETAEHLMLIDLGRNDLGKIAEIGSVKVTEQMVIERYSNVMHISSNIEAILREGNDALDVLRATLPVGTLSGAPKIRAMQIIDELEPVKRGIYGGAVGYLSWNGNMDTAIAIRTAVIQNERLYIQAGCGVVADSKPQSEWQETLNKGAAMFRAVAMAERGLKN